MKLIAWDTSSRSGSVVAFEAEPGSDQIRIISEWVLSVQTSHSEGLLWAIHQVLKSARWTLDEVDCFGVGAGPGSFTGLRIGLTTARTFAHSLCKPLVGVSSLFVLAYPALTWISELQPDTMMIVATDACKGELYVLAGTAQDLKKQAFIQKKSRNVIEDVLTPQKMVAWVSGRMKAKKNKWMRIGEAKDRYPEQWDLLPLKRELRCPDLLSSLGQGRALAEVVWQEYQQKKSNTSALSVFPRYIRASDAEVKLKSGLIKRAPTS